MTKPLISIITPVYNVEPYIYDYLNSVLDQTYTNLEIICVDDGSPDHCGKILDEYAKNDLRLKVVHQSNAGYPNAVNCGLDYATGDYIGFVDPDDWVELDFYEKLLYLAQSKDADIVISNYSREYEHTSELVNNTQPIPEVFDGRNNAFIYGFEADVYRGFKMFLVNKLFKSKFFAASENNGLGLRMSTDFITGGDQLLVTECFLKASKFAYTADALYHYRIRENSIMRSSEFSRRLGLNASLERIADLLHQNSFDKEIINLVKRFHTYYCSQLAEFAFSTGDKKNLEFSKEQIRKYLEEYIESCTDHPDRVERINRILDLEL